MRLVTATRRTRRSIAGLVLVPLTCFAMLLAGQSPAAADLGIEITKFKIGSKPHLNWSCTRSVIDTAVTAKAVTSEPDIYLIYPYADVEADGMDGGRDEYLGATKTANFHVQVGAPDEFTEDKYTFYATVTNGGVASARAEQDKPWDSPSDPPGWKSNPYLCGGSKLLAVAGAALAVAGLWEVFAGSAIVSAAGAKVAVGGLGTLFGTLVNVAFDPPDPNYKELARPDPPTFPSLPAGLSQAQRDTLLAFEAKAAHAAGQLRAMFTSLNRAWGAENASDSPWESKQLAAAQGFARVAADDFDSLGPLMSALEEPLGFDRASATVDPALVEKFRDDLMNGTDKDFSGTLDSMGATPQERNGLIDQLLLTDEPDPFVVAEGGSMQDAMERSASSMSTVAALLRDQATLVTDGDLPGPTITAVSPSSGPDTGGNRVVVTGSHLETTTALTFNTYDASDVSCTDNRCTATAPPGEGGTIDVGLTTLGGDARASYTYTATPHVTGLSPQAGPDSGGNTVRVTGPMPEHLDEVDFGPTPATDINCHVGWCDVTAPPGSGTVDVTWNGLDGPSETSPGDQYTYLAPDPSNLLANGDFEPVDGVPDETQNGYEEFEIGSHIGAWLVSAAPGPGSEGGTAAGGAEVVNANTAQPYSGTQFLKFGVLSAGEGSAPSKISQNLSVPEDHNYRLSFALSGKAGDPAVKDLSVTFGSTIQPLSFDTTGWTSDAQGWRNETVETSTCGTSSLPVAFAQTTKGSRGPEIDRVAVHDLGPDPACTTPPTVGSISPDTGSPSGGTTVSLHGTNLAGVTRIAFGSRSASDMICWSDTLCEAVSPAGTGTVDVTATGPGGTSAISPSDEFDYQENPPVDAPTISRIAPTSGQAGGGTRVTVSGTHLEQVSAVLFGDQPASEVSCTSDSCDVTSPAGHGTVHVTATSPSGTSSTNAADEFTYESSPPAVLKFQALSQSWTSGTRGWALGTLPCPGGVHRTRCSALLRTTDAARTWITEPAPPPVDPTGGNASSTVRRIRFSSDGTGYAFGRALYVTHDLARTWSRIALPQAPAHNSRVISLATGAGRVYVWVRTGHVGRLFSAPTHTDSFALVPHMRRVGTSGRIRVSGHRVLALLRTPGMRPVAWTARVGAQVFSRHVVPCNAHSRTSAVISSHGYVSAACQRTATAAPSLLRLAPEGRRWHRITVARSQPRSRWIGRMVILGQPNSRTYALLLRSRDGFRIVQSTGRRPWKTRLHAVGRPLDIGFTPQARGFAIVGVAGRTRTWATTGHGRWHQVTYRSG